jgi:small subunit ribosomal protein S6
MSRTLSRVERDYDLGIVINPDVGDDQARATVERITQVIATNGGRLVRVNAVGRRRLAYPIEHHRDGLYFFFDLALPPTAVAEVERTLRVNEDIIRHLLVVRDPKLVAQSRQRDVERDAEREAEAILAQQREAEREANAALRAQEAEARAAAMPPAPMAAAEPQAGADVVDVADVADGAATGEVPTGEATDEATTDNAEAVTEE